MKVRCARCDEDVDSRGVFYVVQRRRAGFRERPQHYCSPCFLTASLTLEHPKEDSMRT